MGTRHGYEYRYRIRGNEEISPEEIGHLNMLCEPKVFFFEIRTNFILKKRLVDDDDDDEDLIGSECFDTKSEEGCPEDLLQILMSHRLEAYWMPEDETLLLASRALDFARQRAADLSDLGVIPVVVDLDVCTVQLERESVDDAFGRAIRAECLPPIYLCLNQSLRNQELTLRVDFRLRNFLMLHLSKIRVEDVDQGMSLMDTCSICLRNPTIGTQVSLLPSCGHAFHYHCIVWWLMKSNSCPLCRSRAHNFPIPKL